MKHKKESHNVVKRKCDDEALGEKIHLLLEKEMATHSSVLAWRIPGTGDPCGLPVYGVAQSRTQLKRLSSSSSRIQIL